MRRALPLRRGMTIIEVLVVVGVVILFVALALPFIGNTGHSTTTGRQLKDSTQIRGITQACAIWAQNNNGKYPIPSDIDLTGETIARPAGLVGPDRRLDTTGNMLSMLIWNGFFPVELTVSPAELGKVIRMPNFESASPSTAVNPAKAFWDPAFRGTPLDESGGGVPGRVGDPGHNSYAQAAWFDDRAHMWGDTFNATQAALANRGPAYTLNNGLWEPIQGSGFGSRSTTLNMHGSKGSWSGNVGFNDQHVEFFSQPDPPSVTWTFTGATGGQPQQLPDNMFHAEHDHTRALIGENLQLVAGSDGRGTIHGDGVPGGSGALDQKNNYLRPISKVEPGENGAMTVQFWID